MIRINVFSEEKAWSKRLKNKNIFFKNKNGYGFFMCFNNLMINTYLLLFTAIVFEVAGTMMLPLSQNFTKVFPTAILITCYGLSFYFLSIVSTILPLSVVY